MTFFQKFTLTSNQLLLLVSCYIALILNIPFLIKVTAAVTSLENHNNVFLLSIPVLLVSLTVLIQGLFSHRFLLKPLLMFSVFSGALIFYATLNYGVVFDYGMIQNTFETDSAEALSYLNLSLIFFILFFGVLPAFVIYSIKVSYKPFWQESLSRVKLLGGSMIAIALIAAIFYSNYAAVGRNNRELVAYLTPYKMYDASYKYLKKTYFTAPLMFKVLDDAPRIIKSNSNKHVTVLVVGETARAKNFSINGYANPTNQYTHKYDMISFSQMSSCGTATAVSLPCMFSRLDRESYDKRLANAQQNVIDIVQLAGADVLWLDNNGGSCKGVCVRVDNQRIASDKSNPLCDGKTCYDAALLEPLSDKLNNLSKDNTLIVLHMIGSHGPTYFKRYPDDKRLFTPDCQHSDIQNCSEQELINTYDNTIAYTDYILSEIISRLDQLSTAQGVETSMLYVSDHGESLGEKGVYLHGIPYAFAPVEQTHIPMLFWQNNQQQAYDHQCLASLANHEISHDNLFDTLLNIMSVKSKAYDVAKDAFKACKSPTALAGLPEKATNSTTAPH